MTVRKINIFANDDAYSQEIRELLQRKLQQSGFTVPGKFATDAELIISIGGDGAFLRTLHKYEFLRFRFWSEHWAFGFLQEIHPDELDDSSSSISRGGTTSRI